MIFIFTLYLSSQVWLVLIVRTASLKKLKKPFAKLKVWDLLSVSWITVGSKAKAPREAVLLFG
jgi:hypothetical protein